MKITEGNLQTDIIEIKSKLSDIHTDLKRFLELSKQQQQESVISGIQNSYSNAILGHIIEDIEDGLEKNMVKNCQMRDTCKSIFNGFLKKNANLVKYSNVDEDVILRNLSELQELQNTAPKKQCEMCFAEVSGLFEKQILLMRSLRVYNTTADKKKEISDIPNEIVVSEILEPLSNIQRLQILKAVSIETRTFSSFSELTGLRGGNLLFHLQKLLDSGMILQRHERGDYMITDKGFKVLEGLNEIYFTLIS